MEKRQLKKLRCWIGFIALCLFVNLSFVSVANAEVKVRIKDIANVEGVRDNQLIGYGIVVGLSDSGDDADALFTVQSIVNMLERMGVTIDKEQLKVDNAAGVIVTATLPPFAKAGSRIDVTVSSFGNAESLKGGTLLMTPLKGPDNNVYAVAQGAISLGGTEGGHKTAGTIPSGALIEKEVPFSILKGRNISLSLFEPDFTSAARLAETINSVYPQSAQPADAATVNVTVPMEFIVADKLVSFISMIERLSFVPDNRAKVVINEKTGTIVAGEFVQISTVAISHGNLSVTIKAEELGIKQTIGQKERDLEGHVIVVDKGVNVGEIARALNTLGVTPKDMISIFNALKMAGALQAELTII